MATTLLTDTGVEAVPAEVDYHALNALLNLYDADGRIQFEADRKAAHQYFLQHVNQNTVFFHSLKERLDYLVEKEYYEGAVLEKYPFEFIQRLPAYVARLQGLLTEENREWLSHIVGDRLRAARVTLTVPAVLIMVPGAAAYRAITGVISGDTLSAIQNGFTAVFVVVALAIGLTVARVLTEREWSRP